MSTKIKNPNAHGNKVSKTRRPFGDPVSDPKPTSNFIEIPADQITKPADLSLSLDSVLSAADIKSINKAGKIVFHVVGDSGGVNGTETQEALAEQMENQIKNAADGAKPAFMYHVGDVVYFNGVSTDYEPQFYDPYKYYPANIFAIPGNHDGDTHTRGTDEPDTEPSLYGFIKNFCADKRQPADESPYRYTMNQPYPYWRLDAPFVTIIGLYSNVDGSLDKANDAAKEQYNWYIDQLKAAPKDKCLIVAIHHPCFSLDTAHGGYGEILQDMDNAATKANRKPDVVFSGHVHNYQRFNRAKGNKDYLFLISGAGGYANQARSMHRLQKDENKEDIVVPFQTTLSDVRLDAYNQTEPGFLRITIDDQYISGEYFVNNFDGTPPPVNADDTFKYDWKNNKAVNV